MFIYWDVFPDFFNCTTIFFLYLEKIFRKKCFWSYNFDIFIEKLFNSEFVDS